MRNIGAMWLAVMSLLFVTGHFHGAERGLNPITNYISQYAVGGAWGGLLQVVMVMFGIMLAALAFFLALRAGGSRLRVFAALLLAAACVLAVLTAFHSTYPVAPPAASETSHWWTRVAAWFRSSPQPDYFTQGQLVAVSRVHFTLIQTAIVLVLLAMTALSAHAWHRHFRRAAVSTFAMVAVAACLFTASHLHAWHGLWQRLGFFTILGWVWIEWRKCAGEGARAGLDTRQDEPLRGA